MQETNNSWKLILATFVALGMTVLITVIVTLNWAGDDPISVVPEDEEVGEPTTTVVQEPNVPADQDEDDLRSAELYDLPQRCGMLVAEVDGEKVSLPNMEMNYEVDIRGDLATVVLKQRFENHTSNTVEPVYEFPLYEQAAVYAMSMEIGGKRIDAEIKRKEEAREIYEEARAQGRQAALLEQDRPNLFVQRVANVEPGQQVEITLRYTHVLPKDRGSYHLAIPLVVTDRFTPGDMSGNVLVASDGAADPGASAGGAAGNKPKKVSLSVRIDGGMPVSAIRSPSHSLEVSQFSETVHRASLVAGEDATDRHFRMSYRLAGDQAQVGVNSYWDEEKDAEYRGYFDVIIEPPAQVAATHIPNREMVFVVDNSGSMHSGRMEAANDFVIRALDHLRPDDHFRIIIFNSTMTEYSQEPLQATPQNVEAAQTYMSGVTRGGGTQIVAPLRAALSPELVPETMRLVVVVTDVAVSNDFEIIKAIRGEVGDARLFGLGIGGEVNRYLLDEIGRSGRGFSTQFDMDDNVNRVIDDYVRRLQSPVLTDISVDWGTLDISGVTPSRIPDVFEGGSVRIQGQYANPGIHTIKVKGVLGGEPVVFEKEVKFADSVHDGEAVKLAWARQKIRDEMHELTTPASLRTVEEEDQEVIKERIISLGLGYSLTTQWTSFVAVGDEVDASAQQRPAEDTQIIGALGASSDRSARGGGLGHAGAGLGRPSGQGMNRSRSERAVRSRPAPRRAAAPDADAPQIELFGGAASAPTLDSSPSEPEPQDLNPTMDIGTPELVAGELDTEIIARVVRQHRREAIQCYEQELQREPSLSGSVTISWTIASSGSVVQASVKETTLNNRTVENCISQRMRRWVFPPPSSDEPVRVEVSFTFSTE